MKRGFSKIIKRRARLCNKIEELREHLRIKEEELETLEDITRVKGRDDYVSNVIHFRGRPDNLRKKHV